MSSQCTGEQFTGLFLKPKSYLSHYLHPEKLVVPVTSVFAASRLILVPLFRHFLVRLMGLLLSMETTQYGVLTIKADTGNPRPITVQSQRLIADTYR